MSFEIDDKEYTFVDNLSLSKTIKYSWDRGIYKSSTMLEVYNFCLNEINILKNRYKYTYLTLDLYIIYEDENNNYEETFKHIYYLEQDLYGQILKEEKPFLNENTTIPANLYYIYILINTIEKPPPVSQQSLTNILYPVFKPFASHQVYDERKTIYFKTKAIESGRYTAEQIYSKTLPFLINFQIKYKNDRITNRPATKTSYEIYITGLNLYHSLYYTELDNNGSIIFVSDNYNNIQQYISSPFKVNIKIEIYCDPEEEIMQTTAQLLENIRTLTNQLQSLSIQPATRRKKFLKDDTCCICLENPPTILFPDCGHACTCNQCEEIKEQTECPKCRTRVTVGKITI